MRLVICGARGSTPAPGPQFARYGGHTSCVTVTDDDGTPRLILDAGTGIRRVSELVGHEVFEGTILLTHLHWDHVQGLPFFAAADHSDARVTLAVPAQSPGEGDHRYGAGAEAAIAKMMSPPHFPIDPGGLRGDWCFVELGEGPHVVGGLQVHAVEVPHKGGRTYGYRITDGTSVVAYVPDHSPIAHGAGPERLGAYHDAIRTLAADVDVLLHDSQHLRREFATRQVLGHATVEYADGLARACGVRRLVLFHHDPGRTDDELDAILDRHRRTTGLQIDAAFEAMRIDLPR